MVDVLIIGGGVVGAAIAYELSKHELSVTVLEKENDLAMGTTKANSAILHSGYDPEPGTLMARLNVEGVELTKEICRKLDVPIKCTGSLTVALCEEDMETLKTLYKRGLKNGVPGLEILDRAHLIIKEPNISKNALGALWAPTAAILNPWELCLAMAETAVINGAQLHLNSKVIAINKEGDVFTVECADGRSYMAKTVINAAGVHSDTVHDLIAKPSFRILPRSGEYFLLDKSEGERVRSVIFQCPQGETKGVLVAPTVHGNLIVGPDNERAEAEDTSSSSERLATVRETAKKSVPSIAFNENIRNFAGLRAVSDADDFIIGETEVKGFFDVAGIKSPGLSAAAAIGLYVKSMLEDFGLSMKKKENYIDDRHILRFSELGLEEKRAAITKNPQYGRVVCRCEKVTEGEILDSLNSPIPPRTVDGVKRRVMTGAGRCQGGFCAPKVIEILAREWNLSPLEIQMDREGSYILTGETKEAQA